MMQWIDAFCQLSIRAIVKDFVSLQKYKPSQKDLFFVIKFLLTWICCFTLGVLLNNSSPLFNDNDNGNPDRSNNNNDPFEQTIDVDELLANNSVMFPILDSNEGDVNDLFGELELLLAVSVAYCLHFSNWLLVVGLF